MGLASDDVLSLATNRWEDARSSLANSLKTYLNSCISLDLDPDLGYGHSNTKDLASRIDSTLGSLHEMSLQFAQSIATISRIRNKFASPIWSLPKEIISEIFLNIVYAPETMNLPMTKCLQTMYRNLHSLMAVCSVWRHLALIQGQLWETVPASNDPIKRVAVDLSIERSRGRALRFAAILPKGGAPAFLLKAVTEQASRICSLNVQCLESKPLRDIITAVLKADAPSRLSQLSIYCRSYKHMKAYILLPDSPNYSTFNELMKSLSALRLGGLRIHWENIVFSNRLVELCLRGVTLGSDSAMLSFLSALTSASELRDLKIMFVVAHRRPGETVSLARSVPKVAFPKLQYLLLSDLPFNVLEFFLLAIAPCSYHLTVDISKQTLNISGGDHWAMGQVSPGDLAALLSPVDIDSLYLLRGPLDAVDLWLTGSGFRQLLGSTPRLKELTINGWVFDTAFCNGLCPLSPDESESPNLEILRFLNARISDEEGFKRIATGIPAQTMVFGGYIEAGSGKWVEPKGDNDVVSWLESNIPSLRLVDSNYKSLEFSSDAWLLW
ncbi:unnamed protein product [Rhizoctonia solani]|uniref:F-box domain-containing protein n=1 Tax=Rhizoctonia solani TaxID=456999 RepID=A0A8H3C6H0_9AGAM|nr:unnamed protein product [Rhizoctonia solani]